MDRGVWWATVQGVTKELDMTQRLKNSIPLYGRTTLYFTMHQLMTIWVVSTFWFL